MKGSIGFRVWWFQVQRRCVVENIAVYANRIDPCSDRRASEVCVVEKHLFGENVAIFLEIVRELSEEPTFCIQLEEFRAILKKDE